MRWISTFALFLATGCLGGPKQEPTYFTLSAVAAPDGAPVATRPELGLALGQVEIPRYLDRPELVTRTGPHRLRMWNGVRWGGSLQDDVQRVLADDLSRLLGTTRVAVYPDEARFPVKARVLVELLDLGGAPGQPVVLRSRYTLAGADGRALAVGELDLSQPAASASWDDYVAAQRGALDALARGLAERIIALP
jgi:hypothetical protein